MIPAMQKTRTESRNTVKKNGIYSLTQNDTEFVKSLNELIKSRPLH